MGASSRLRTYQFSGMWEAEGYEITIAPFFNETYLLKVYAHQQVSKKNVLHCYWSRFLLLFTLGKYDLIWVEKEIFPYLPSYAERLISKLGKGYVVDFDDAVFHNYDKHKVSLIRNWMGSKIDEVMRHSRLVWVGNPYLEDRAKKAGAIKIEYLPTVITAHNYLKKKAHFPQPNILTIGWIGSPTTLKYLKALVPMLEILNKLYPIELLVVNGTKGIEFSGKMRHLQWTEENEVAAIHQMDIGIMPLPDDHWERGKCAYKLIQYMGCGLPVVASPVGMNSQIVRHGENGYLATTEQEWIESLSELIQHPEKRQAMGASGFATVHANFTRDKNFLRMMAVVEAMLPTTLIPVPIPQSIAVKQVSAVEGKTKNPTAKTLPLSG